MNDEVQKNAAGSIITIALVFGVAYAIVLYHIVFFVVGYVVNLFGRE